VTTSQGLSDEDTHYVYYDDEMAKRASESKVNIPQRFVLEQNHPNPFNPETEIRYALPRAGRVELVILNISGQVVRTLVASEQAPGTYRQVWDGRDRSGHAVASGIYLCRLQVIPNDGGKPFVAVRKMALAR